MLQGEGTGRARTDGRRPNQKVFQQQVDGEWFVPQLGNKNFSCKRFESQGNFILSTVYLQEHLPDLELVLMKNVRRKVTKL